MSLEQTSTTEELTPTQKFDNLWAYIRGEFAIERNSAHLDPDGCVSMTLAASYNNPQARERIRQNFAKAGLTVLHFTNDGPRTPVASMAASAETKAMNILETSTSIDTIDLPARKLNT
jgi:hypothetical protein